MTTLAPLRPTTSATRSICLLEDAIDPAYAGGKAANLARMSRLGFQVPEGIVLTTAALDAFLERNELRPKIDALVASCMPDCDAERQQSEVAVWLTRSAEVAAEIQQLFADANIDSEFAENVARHLEDVDARCTWAVRSSAVGEDADDASFAGQLDTILDVEGPDAIEAAVRKCWASLWSARALFYRSSKGLHERGMAVIVQRLVPARVSGVLFTSAAPAGSVLVEYGGGLGEALVSGSIDPGRFTITGSATVARLSTPDPAVPDENLVYDPSMITTMANVARRLEKEFGAPQDVEWAIDAHGTLHVLQSRPITAPLSVPDLVHWSNANVNENFPDPISPLLYSVASAGYAAYFRNLAQAFGISKTRINAMEPHLSRIIGVHGARMYYDLTSIHAVLRMAPFGEQLAEAFNRFVGVEGTAPQPGDAESFAQKSGHGRRVVEALQIAASTSWHFMGLRRRVSNFEQAADDFAAASHPSQLHARSVAELRALLLSFMNIRTSRWLGASLADAAAMMCYAALERTLSHTRSDGRSGAGTARHNGLLKAIPNVVSAIPTLELWKLSRLVRADSELRSALEENGVRAILSSPISASRFPVFAAELQQYVDEWGFRCSSELMLTVPSFQEDPEPLGRMILAYADVDGDGPLEVMRRLERERELETAAVLHDLRGQRLVRFLPFLSRAHALRVLLPCTHAAIAIRERARLKQALLYSRCRRIALALGAKLATHRLLARADDVFLLSVDELDALAAGRSMLPHHTAELVALRRRAHADVSATTPPDSFVLARGEYLATTTAHADRSGCKTEPGCEDAREDTLHESLSGTSACGGRVTARAAVLTEVSETHRLSHGDILVTRQTDPGWGPVFFLVSGLVIERGGMLSHGAILAREFGLPCVVGVQKATTRIAHGVELTVDGDAGAVHVHD